MSATTVQPAARAASSPSWIGFAVLALFVWGGLIAKLTTDWSTNPQYEFGYFVPFFVVYLLLRRWEDRPSPSIDAGNVGYFVAACGVMLLLLPVRVIHEANPDWRPFNWVHASIVVLITVLLIARIGGRAWAAHFVLPLFLMFFALPWPLGMEQGMIKELTGAVTRATVELLNWINVPALQRGNVIEVAAGSVGVADACSGMRSLAGTLMAAAFFGEYYRLGWLRRLLLIVVGCSLAFAFNIGRTFFLGWRTAAEGTQAVDQWHDPAGYTIFVISFACLWLLARWVNDADDQRAPAAPGQAGVALPVSAVAVCALWLIGTHVATEAWYRFREGERTQTKQWSVALPEDQSYVRPEQMPDEVRSILRFSEGSSMAVDWPDGRSWHVIVLQWDPGRSSAQLATMHRPEICMPAAGFVYLGPTPSVPVKAKDIQLTFDGSIFDSAGQQLFVYRCLWEDHTVAGAAWERRFDMSVRGRLLSSWYGRRNLGQKLVQIGISGAASEGDAREDLQRRFPSLIQIGS